MVAAGKLAALVAGIACHIRNKSACHALATLVAERRVRRRLQRPFLLAEFAEIHRHIVVGLCETARTLDQLVGGSQRLARRDADLVDQARTCSHRGRVAVGAMV
jgi:hypothetical protein